MDFPLVFEDDAFAVINKPPGIVVNNATSVKGETVQTWARACLGLPDTRAWGDDFESRAGIVHRIDKETSGLLIVAKTPAAFAELQRQFAERIIKKTYRAIAHEIIVPATGEIRAPVGRLPWNREQFGIVPGGREAVTKYSVLYTFLHGKEKYTWVELYPETGRTHQIRVHLKYINHPILGDFLYAGRKVSRNDRTWAPRIMLHAYSVRLIHPVTGETLAFTAPIPDDMNGILPPE